MKIISRGTGMRTFRKRRRYFIFISELLFIFVVIIRNNSVMKILLVEDEPQLRELLRTALEKERYVVECAETYAAAVEKTGVYEYDCILLDIMLPDGNGIDLLNKMKEEHRSVNVIIISAKDSVDDKVAGLQLGADDYLAKPFHIAELFARIRSVTRRRQQGGERGIRIGNVYILPEEFSVEVDGKMLELNRKEFDILHFFANRTGRLINKTMLAESVWGDYIDQVDNFDFIYAQIKNLRKKLTAAGASVQIKAVYGIGYKMETED